jgi:hypothetical protein
MADFTAWSMGFFFGLVGYLTAITLMVGGAIATAVWVTRPMPEPAPVVTAKAAPQVNDSAKRMRGANAALVRPSKKRPAKRRKQASRHTPER